METQCLAAAVLQRWFRNHGSKLALPIFYTNIKQSRDRTFHGYGIDFTRKCVVFLRSAIMRILLLEDQSRFAQLLKDCFRADGYAVDVVSSIAAFEAVTSTGNFDVLIVDLGLPDGDGLEAIRNYRKRGGTAPIIIVTARNKVNDLVVGLDSGADDFVAKPFHIEVLKARIRTLQRRPPTLAAKTQVVGRIALDRETGNILFEDGNISLSPAERRLLALLMRRAGSVVSKNLIECQVQGTEHPNTPNAVEQLVSRLRKSLSRSRSGVDVKTIRGIGYVLEERVN